MYKQAGWAIRTQDENGTQETIVTDGKQVYASLVKAARDYEQVHPGVTLRGDKHQVFRMADGTPIVLAKPILEKVKADPKTNYAMDHTPKRSVGRKKLNCKWQVEVLESGWIETQQIVRSYKEVWPTIVRLMKEYKESKPGLRFMRDEKKENRVGVLSMDKRLYIYAHPL